MTDKDTQALLERLETLQVEHNEAIVKLVAAWAERDAMAEALGSSLDLIDELYRKYHCELDHADVETAQNARNVWLAALNQPLMDEG